MIPARRSIIWDVEALVPREWSRKAGNGWRVFNPGIARDGRGGYVMAYRVVTPVLGRKIALCRLDASLGIVPGSVTPFSDLVAFDDPAAYGAVTLDWHADPRLISVEGGCHICWNDGNIENNNQFLAPIDPASLRPTGAARRMSIAGRRRSVEKNWGVFAEERVKAVYSADPLRIIGLGAGLDGELRFSEVAAFPQVPAMSALGELRGGAPPVLHAGEWYNFAHVLRRQDGRKIYDAALYTFGAGPGNALVRAPIRRLDLPNPFGSTLAHKPLHSTTGEVIYVCGALREPGGWLITYGINDERSAAYLLPDEDVDDCVAPVAPAPAPRGPAAVPMAPPPERAAGRVPTYFWDAAGGAGRFRTGNFGDLIGPGLIRALSGRDVALVDGPGAPRKLLTVGSVLHRARDGDVIWGTGLKGSAPRLAPEVRALDVRAVRGPVTLDFLRRKGIDVGRVTQLFDPGSLVGAMFPDAVAEAGTLPRRPFLIVPHFRDLPILLRRRPDLAGTLVSPDGTVADVVRRIASAERIVSSSLHGIIVAEALGIPAVWLAPAGGEDEMKYSDYYFGTGRYAIRRAAKLDDALRAEPMPLPRLDVAAMLASFPHDAIPSLLVG